jgi:hypothetical protein
LATFEAELGPDGRPTQAGDFKRLAPDGALEAVESFLTQEGVIRLNESK